jgi:small subunit ribosomal protein S17
MAEKTIRTLSGVIVSNKMDKSVVVLVTRQVTHPLYKKVMRRSTKVMAHDESNQCNIGDVVTIRECPPISRRKFWDLVQINKKAVQE